MDMATVARRNAEESRRLKARSADRVMGSIHGLPCVAEGHTWNVTPTNAEDDKPTFIWSCHKCGLTRVAGE